jgi:hypothetical protein
MVGRREPVVEERVMSFIASPLVDSLELILNDNGSHLPV